MPNCVHAGLTHLQRRPHAATIALVAAGVVAQVAQAQSYSGGRWFSLDEGPSESSSNLTFACGTDLLDIMANKPVGCISAPLGPGADEFVHWERRDEPGLVGGHTRGAVSVLFHRCVGAGSVTTQLLNQVVATDLVFYDRLNPSLPGSADVVMKVEFRGRVSGVDGASCAGGRARVEIFAGTSLGSNTFTFSSLRGAFSASGDSNGPLASYANDESPLIFPLPAATRALNTQYRIGLKIDLQSAVGSCGPNGDNAFMDARGTISLPTSGTVFNLPGNITCSSAQLNIVDNVWMGTPSLTITQQPAPVTTCGTGSAVFGVTASGGLSSFQWRFVDPDTGALRPIIDGINLDSVSTPRIPLFTATGATTGSVTLSPDSGTPGSEWNFHAWTIDCIVSSACSSVASSTATLTVLPDTDPLCGGCPCPADFDGSGGTPDIADIDAFFDAWLAGDGAADADCTGGTPDVGDITDFFVAWLAGGC